MNNYSRLEQSVSSYKIVLGDSDLHREFSFGKSSAQSYGIAEALIHPKFDSSGGASVYNIGMSFSAMSNIQIKLLWRFYYFIIVLLLLILSYFDKNQIKMPNIYIYFNNFF